MRRSFAFVVLLVSMSAGLPSEYESQAEPAYDDEAESEDFQTHAAPAAVEYAAPAAVQEQVIQGHITHSISPTQVHEYHYHTHKLIPSHEVKTFQTHSTNAKKIIHQHNQQEKIIHKQHHHENILREHNLHMIHLHNVHLQKHHVHLNNVHREHVYQPIYHKQEHQTVKVTEEHQTKNTEGETHEHRQSHSETKSNAPAIHISSHQSHQSHQYHVAVPVSNNADQTHAADAVGSTNDGDGAHYNYDMQSQLL